MPGKEAGKAYVSGVIAFLGTLVATWTVAEAFHILYVLASLGSGLAAFQGVYWTPNQTDE